jgi:hypothetical protein
VFDILVLLVVVQSLTLPKAVHSLASALGVRDAPQLVRRATAPYAESSGLVANGCSPQDTGTPGFRAVFYPYTLNDATTNRNLAYMETGFKSGALTATVNGITSPGFSGTSGVLVTYGTVYGQRITTSNFGLQLTGYFLATESGLWTMAAYADDTAMVRFGGGNAFQCCSVATATTARTRSFSATTPPRTAGSSPRATTTRSRSTTRSRWAATGCRSR